MFGRVRPSWVKRVWRGTARLTPIGAIIGTGVICMGPLLRPWWGDHDERQLFRFDGGGGQEIVVKVCSPQHRQTQERTPPSGGEDTAAAKAFAALRLMHPSMVKMLAPVDNRTYKRCFFDLREVVKEAVASLSNALGSEGSTQLTNLFKIKAVEKAPLGAGRRGLACELGAQWGRRRRERPLPRQREVSRRPQLGRCQASTRPMPGQDERSCRPVLGKMRPRLARYYVGEFEAATGPTIGQHNAMSQDGADSRPRRGRG